MKARRLLLAAGLALPMGLGSASLAQVAEGEVDDGEIILPDMGQTEHEFDERSGLVRNRGDEPAVVWSTMIHVPGAHWVRLQFEDVLLSGTPFEPDESYLRITSPLDGAVQTLNQVHVSQWNETSAYFNGDTVLVEIIASPHSGDNHVAVVGASAGTGFAAESICGSVDDRVLSDDPRQGRYLPAGCTAWIFNDDNSCIGTAGHCISSNGVIQFNVPLSNSNGSIVHPPPEDQYSIDDSSRQWTSGGTGNDWGYMGAFPNSNTGLTAYEAQGERYDFALAAPPVQDQTIRISGYGTTSFPVDPRWNQVQKTHTGPFVEHAGTRLRYAVDTTGGNSGSPVVNEDTGEVIGVHTHAGCNSVGGNQGTAAEHSNWLDARDNPLGVCAPPPPPPDSEMFVAASQRGEVGAVNPTDGTWGVAANTGQTYSGMAYDHTTRTYYMVSTTGPVLYSMSESSYDIESIGTIQGANRLDALAFDPNTGTLYGIDNRADGQLYTIDTSSARATPVGNPGGGSVTALAFDEDRGRLYGISNDQIGSRLMLIDERTGNHGYVGLLGNGLRRADGLTWRRADGKLYTIDSSDEKLYTVDQRTGASTYVTDADLDLSSSFGMAAGTIACEGDINGDGELNVQDFFDYLDLFAAGDNAADLDGDGDVDVEDFFTFLDVFAQGC